MEALVYWYQNASVSEVCFWAAMVLFLMSVACLWILERVDLSSYDPYEDYLDSDDYINDLDDNEKGR